MYYSTAVPLQRTLPRIEDLGPFATGSTWGWIPRRRWFRKSPAGIALR